MNTPDFEVLVSQYKALNRRTKERIRQRFNEHFKLSDGDTTFLRLMNERLHVCYDEYAFLINIIPQHYQFENNRKKAADAQSAFSPC